MPSYTVGALAAALAVVGVEIFWLRTGIFRRASYWLTMAIIIAFQVPVDGWLTKLSAPIVRYNSRRMSGVRFPWDIPVEDFVFTFALVTLVLALWVRAAPPATQPVPLGAVSLVGSTERPSEERAQ